MSRPVGGILSTLFRGLGGHPSERFTWRWCPNGHRTGSPPSISTLLRVGFTEPTGSPRPLVRSYRTVSPLPVCRPETTPSAVCSLWHFPAGRPDWPLASTLPSGVPTFLDPCPTGHHPIRTSRDHPAGSPSPSSSHRLPTCGRPGRRHPAFGLPKRHRMGRSQRGSILAPCHLLLDGPDPDRRLRMLMRCRSATSTCGSTVL